MRSRLRISDLVLPAALLVSGALAGCSTSGVLERYPRGEVVGNQGGSSDMVFAAADARSAPDWEYARLDGSMNMRGLEEAANPPDLEQLRFINLNPRSDRIFYYQQRYYVPQR